MKQSSQRLLFLSSFPFSMHLARIVFAGQLAVFQLSGDCNRCISSVDIEAQFVRHPRALLIVPVPI